MQESDTTSGAGPPDKSPRRHSRPSLPRIHLEPQPGQTELVKDANGWSHMFQDGKEIDCFYMCSGRDPDRIMCKTLEGAVKLYEERAAQWKSSSCFKDLKEFLENKILPLEHLKLDTCIGLGFGSFTRARSGNFLFRDESRDTSAQAFDIVQTGGEAEDVTAQLSNVIPMDDRTKASMAQLASFEAMVEIIRESHHSWNYSILT